MARVQRTQSLLKYGAITVLVAAAITGVRQLVDLQGLLIGVLSWIEGLGFWGLVAFIAIYAAGTVLFAPGLPLTLGAGFLFGVKQGIPVAAIGATLGATLAFLIGRYVARGWVNRQIAGRPNFQAIDRAIAEEGWQMVLLTRLSPVFPFNLLNYALGLTQVSLPAYFFPTLFGILPALAVYVYVGSLMQDLAAIAAGEVERTPAQWALLGVGLLATILVAVLVARRARNALKQRVEPAGDTAQSRTGDR